VDDRTRIGARVRSARLRRGLSLDVLAGLVGHSKSWLSKVERGLLPLDRRSDLAALAGALEVSPTELTGQRHPGRDRDGSDEDTEPAVRRALLDRPPATSRPVEVLGADLAVLAARQQAGRMAEAAVLTAPLLAGLRAAATGSDHAAARRLTVLACYYAHSVLQAGGHYDLALLVSGLSERAAAELGDPVLAALAAVTRVYGLVQVPVGAYGAALDLAAAAGEDVSRAPGREAVAAAGQLQLAAATAAAALGEADHAADRLAAAGQLAGALAEPASTMFGRHLGFGPINVAVHQVSVGVETGRPDTAVAASRVVDPTAIPYALKRAVWLGDLGRAHAALGQVDQATAALRAAEQIAPMRVRLHPLIRETVAGMVDRVQRAAVGRELRGLAYRMGLPH
jgi:transcriptional regulator with XRE-family HTH domain